MPALATKCTPDRSCAGRDVEAGLTVFARALAGNSGLPASCETASALPERVERFDDYADNRSWYVVAYAHRALHQAAATFDLDWSVPPALFDPLTPTLPTPAGATDLWGFFALFAERDLAVDLFTLLEDLRVDEVLARTFSGMARSLRRVRADALAELPPSAVTGRGALVDVALRLSLGDWTYPVPAPLAPAAGALGRIARTLTRPEATVRDTAEATLRTYVLVTSLGATAAGAASEDVSLESAMAMGSEPRWPRGWPEPRRSVLEGDRALALEVHHPAYRDDLLGAYARRPQLPASGDQGVYDVVTETVPVDDGEPLLGPRPPEEPVDTEERLDPTDRTEQTLEARHHTHSHWTDFTAPAPAPIPDGSLLPDGDGTWIYPEWDDVAGWLRVDWCRLRERVPVGSVTTSAHRVAMSRYGGLLPRLRREFERIAPEGRRAVHGVADGDDVDLDAAVETLTDVRAGVIASDDVYERREHVRRDVAVAFLLDLSSSTAEHVKTRPFQAVDPALRRIIDVERVSAALLIESLRGTADPFGVYGFSSNGRDQVEVVVVKDLTEPLTEAVLHRVDGLRPVQGTRMGTPIRHLTAKLDRTASATKLLVIVTDGRPHDLGYGHEYAASHQDLDYALGDTRHALEQAVAHGVRPYLLTVDASGDEYLARVCGDLPHEVLSDVESLPERLLSLYHEMAARAVITIGRRRTGARA